MKKVIILLLLLGVVGGVGGWYWHSSGAHPATFKTTAVKRGDLQATISATGTVEPEEVVDVGAQVAGMIDRFGKDPHDAGKLVNYGTAVEEGTVLAHIDDVLFAAEVEQAQAQVEQAKANVQHSEADLQQAKAKLYQAERDWNRAKRLGPANAIAQSDYDVAQATYETSKAAVAVADASVVQAKKAVAQNEAALKKAKRNLDYCTIKSPVKGVIVDRRVNTGQTVVASLNAPSLFLIAKDLRRMQVWASVNEADIGQIHKGQPVSFTVDAHPGEVFRGEVNQVRLNATMTQNVVTYTVEVNFDNPVSKDYPQGKLLPYLTANLQFEVSQRHDVLLVPNAALRWLPQERHVALDAREAFARSAHRRGGSGGGGPAAGAAPGEKPPAKAEKVRHDAGTLWVEDGGYVRPLKVHVGLSDGTVTEVSGEGLDDGTVVVIGEVRNNTAESATNPFAPQMFNNRRQ